MAWLFSLVMALNAVFYSHAEVRLPPNIIEPRTVTVKYYPSNSDFVIPCKAESKPNSPTYKWLKGTTPIVPGQYVKFDATTGDLSFTGFTLREEGDFMCVATTVFTSQGGGRISAASFSPIVSVYQIRLDTFTDQTPISKSADEYSYIKLECANQGKFVGDKIDMNWYKSASGTNRILYDNGRLFMDQKGTLHFTFVKGSDKTTTFPYLCGITSTDEKLERFGAESSLQVREVASPTPVKPLLQYSNNGLVANLYSTATLECVFSGYDPQAPHIPKIKWAMDDGSEISTGGRYIISADDRTLTITSVTEQDEKNYYCSAKNSAGTVPAQPVFLNVTSAPIFVEGPRDQTVSEGKDVVFSCDARSASNEHPPSAPNWYINGEATGPHTDRNKYVIENKKLTVKGVNKARDILCVQCSVTNARGTTWGDGCLNVLLPITITQQPALEQSIVHGDVIDLTIKATTDESQTLAYKWLHFQNKSTIVGEEPRFLIIDPVTHATFYQHQSIVGKGVRDSWRNLQKSHITHI